MSAPGDAGGAGERDATIGAAAWCVLTARVLMGLWFIYSGGTKLWVSGLERFVRDLGNYRLLPGTLLGPAAYAVPWVEIVTGLCLVLGFWLRGAILVMFGLVTGFALFVGWAWQQQLDISCGCHGSDEPIRYWAKAVEFICYFVVLAWLAWWERRARPSPGQKIQNMA